MGDQALGRQPARQRNAQVGGGPALALHAQGGMGVFGDGLGREPADPLDRDTPQDGARPAEECRIPEIISVLDHAIEQVAFGWGAEARGQIALERVGGIEVMRRLHERDLGSPTIQPW